MDKINKTKVRYGVHFNDKNYEYVLHSNKKFYLRNIADVVNVVEYCVTKELKADNYKVGDNNDKFFNVEIIRFVNDVEDTTWMKDEFKAFIKGMIDQVLVDNVQRNA